MCVFEFTQVSLLILRDSYEFVGKTGNSAHGVAEKHKFGKRMRESDKETKVKERENDGLECHINIYKSAIIYII